MNTRKPQPTETWAVLVLYEDRATRNRAMEICDRLVQQFWSEVEFDFRWWRADFLADAAMAQTAANDARLADFIVVCLDPETELSPDVARWFATWTDAREGREGALLDLTPAEALTRRAAQKRNRLQEFAHRAMLDYLTQIPPKFAGVLPESWENAESRGTQMTSVLDDILHHIPPPTHFGLNE